VSDRGQGGGMSALEGYALGRMAERGQQETLEFAQRLARRVGRRESPIVDVDTLLAENAMLRSQLDEACSNFDKLRLAHDRLRAWGTKASQVMREHGLIQD